MIVYEDVNGIDFIDEFERILPEHYEELSVTKEFPLEPNWDAYRAYANGGMLRTITCRNDGELIGYIVFFIQPHPHYKSCITAYEDVYYIRKDYRKGRVGIKLFQYAEKVLKERGVHRMVIHTKVHLDNSRLLEYMDYKLTDKLFSKLL